MTENQLKEYMGGRYQEMLSFYDKRAIQNKRGYRILSVYIIVASLLLAPVVTAELGGWRILLAILSSSIGMAAALLSHFKFHENWLRYRATWDCLKREVQLKAAGIGEYANHHDPNNLFVQRVEAVFAGEGIEWLSVQARIDDSSDGQKAGAIQTRQY